MSLNTFQFLVKKVQKALHSINPKSKFSTLDFSQTIKD